MQEPKEYDWTALKRLGRFLVGKPRLIQAFEEQPPQNVVKVMTDSDQSGDLLTRRSTSGFVAMCGKHSLKHGSNSQPVPKMSSGEAEYSGVVKGASIGMGVQSMYEDYNEKMKLIVFTDSSTARSITQRRGIGKI